MSYANGRDKRSFIVQNLGCQRVWRRHALNFVNYLKGARKQRCGQTKRTIIKGDKNLFWTVRSLALACSEANTIFSNEMQITKCNTCPFVISPAAKSSREQVEQPALDFIQIFLRMLTWSWEVYKVHTLYGGGVFSVRFVGDSPTVFWQIEHWGFSFISGIAFTSTVYA